MVRVFTFPRWREGWVKDKLKGLRRHGLAFVWGLDRHRMWGLIPVSRVKVICGDYRTREFLERVLTGEED